jgi:hypothetical protein
MWLQRSTTASFVLTKWANSSPFRHEFVMLLHARKDQRARNRDSPGGVERVFARWFNIRSCKSAACPCG